MSQDSGQETGSTEFLQNLERQACDGLHSGQAVQRQSSDQITQAAAELLGTPSGPKQNTVLQLQAGLHRLLLVSGY